MIRKLYGKAETNNTISGNAHHDTFEDDEAAGFVELLGIQVIPDLDPTDLGSNLEKLQLLVDDNQKGYDMVCNHYYNMLPWTQIHPGRRPLQLFEPSIKINKGRDIVLRVFAGATAVDLAYWIRPVGIMRDEEAVKEDFGLDDPFDFETLEGGISQSGAKVEPFFKYGRNKAATTANDWYDINDLSFRIYAHQELTVVAIGCLPDEDQTKFQLADIDRTIIATEHPLIVTTDFNEAPFGCAWQDAGPFTFPEPCRPIFKDDFIRTQVQGDAIMAINDTLVFIKGIWRTGV